MAGELGEGKNHDIVIESFVPSRRGELGPQVHTVEEDPGAVAQKRSAENTIGVIGIRNDLREIILCNPKGRNRSAKVGGVGGSNKVSGVGGGG